MEVKQLRRKTILILLIISILMPYIPVFTQVSQAVNDQTFNYTGGIQTYTVETSGTYKLEVWAGSGGYDKDSTGSIENDPIHSGSGGGYSYGNVKLNKGDILYIGVGGQGKDCDYTMDDPNSGGYNGGSGSSPQYDDYEGGGGGGATHIALNKNLGVLSNYINDKNNILIVAGGGAGASTGTNWYDNGCPGRVRTRFIAPGGGIVCRKTTYYAECREHIYGSYDDCSFEKGNREVGENPPAGQSSVDNENDFGKATAYNSGGGWYGGTSSFYIVGGTPGSSYIGGVFDGGVLEGENYGNGKARITLVKANAQTLTVNPNGGIYNGTTENTSYTIEIGTKQQIVNPTKEGHRFTGWTLSGKDSTINGTTFTMGTEDATLTANWTQNEYTVTCIDIVNGTNKELGRSNWSEAYGKTVRGSHKGEDTTLGRYYIGYTYTSDTQAIVGTNGATVYRYFDPGIYNLNVNPNGGTWEGTNDAQNFTIAYQGTKNISVPYRTGYTFDHWDVSGAGSSWNGSIFTMGYENANMIAQWRINSYNLHVNPNGGTWEGSNKEQDFSIQYRDTKIISNPTRIGFTFSGWSQTGEGYTLNENNFTMGYTDVSLTANWTRNNYNLSVNPNEGTWEGSKEVQNFSIPYDETKNISNPIRYGYSFNGWNLNPGLGSSLNGTTFRMGYENATLTANWNLITHNITGTVNWNDQNNKYSSRPEHITVTLSRTPTTGEVTPIPAPIQIRGNATFNFNNVQTYDTTNGNAYTYQISQNKVPGYKTTISAYNITNQLIVPTYSSNISYSPIDTYRNLYLKNGKVKITANIQSTSGNTYQELGLNNGIVNFTIDQDIKLDTNTLKIYHTDNSGNRKQITQYTLNGNILTVDFGENKISKSKDKIEIEVYGTLNKIKEYTSSITLTGNLRAYDGQNTNINLGTLTTKTEKITAEHQMPQANIKITKHDSITEQSLTDAIFTLYEWNGNTFVEKEIITDTNNDGIYESKYYEWNKITQGKYKIVETGVPVNHKNLQFSMEFTINKLAQENYTITPDYSNKEYKITYNVRTPDDFDNTNGIVENEPYKIKASIDLLDSENLRQIQNEATFKIYEWDKNISQYKIYTSYTTGKEVKIKRLENKTYITEEWLYYTSNNEGKFRIVEEKAPTGYYGDYEDDQASKKRTYDINIVDLIGTNENQNETTIALSNRDGKFVNQRTKAIINLNKIDSETKGSSQGDATLQGAIYEIYASVNIYHADGITSNYSQQTALLYKQNQLVMEKATNEEGKLAFDNLECGKYYIKEKTPSNGYMVDTNTYEIDVTYQNETIKLITKEQTSEEKVKKQGFQIYKIKQTDRTEYEGLQDAGFTIYKINNLSIVKDGKIAKNQDGTYTLNDDSAKNDPSLTKLANRNGTYKIQDLVDYYYKIKYTEDNMGTLPQDQNSYHPYNINEEKVKDYASSTQGSYIEELKSNGDGYIRSPELAYGEYIVIETTVPKNLETAKPFYINVQNDSREVQKLKFITDENYETKVKIYKVDQTTGKTVLKTGAKYIIRNEVGDLVTFNTWDANKGYTEYGTLENPFTTGNDGYLITPMNLKVGKYTLEEIEAPDGYVLVGHEGTSVNGQTIKNPSAQITFEISTNAIYYTDDFLDANVIVVKQQNQPQIGSLTLSTKGDYIVNASKDEQGNYNFIYEERPIEGVTYEIRAKENILTVDGQNNIIYQKDQLVNTVTSNNFGIAYVNNLPQGKYYIVQTIAGNGFSLNEEQKEFEVKYGTNQKDLEEGTKEWKDKSQETPVIYIEENYKNQNQKLQITVEKRDEETDQKIAGAQIGLYVGNDIVNTRTNEIIIAKDTLVEAVTTNEEGKIAFKDNIPLGTYYVKEIKAPQGYIYNGEAKIIDGQYDSSQIAVKQINQTIQNRKTNINIQKTTKEGLSLSGATLELRDSNNQIIETWITDEEVKNIKALKINEQYRIIETSPSLGYVTANEITFTINDYGNIQTEAKIKEQNTIIMEDQETKIIVELLDAKTKEQVSGAMLKILNDKGEEVAKFETSNIAEEIQKLPIGQYTIIEEQAPQDKGYVTIPNIPFEIRDTEEIQRIVITQEYTKLQISLKDIETQEPVVRATLQLIKKTEENEQIVEEWVSLVEPHLIEKLPIGKYYIRETVTPTDRGYVTISEQEIEIKDVLQIQNIELLNDITKVRVNLIDRDEKTSIVGATLQIIKKDTNEVVKEWETTEEPYNIKRLPVGSYIVKNKKANTELGQITINPKELNVIDTDKIQEITLEQDYTKLEIELLDKETKDKLEGVKFEIYKVNIGENGEKIYNEKVREFTTGKENYNTTKLGVGEYLIHEVENQEKILQNEGYVTIQDTYFEIEDNPAVKKITLEQDHTKVEIELIDRETTNKLEGIKLEIYKVITNEQGEKQRQEKVREFITGKDNYQTIKLPVGEYLVHEVENQIQTIQNNGYTTIKDKYFKVENKQEIQKVTIEQDYTKVEIELLDKETLEKIEGVKFEIYKIIQDEQGEKKPSEKVNEFVTGKENKLIEKLPIGEYIIHEVKDQKDTLLDKGYVTIEDKYFKVEDKLEIQKVKIIQEESRLEIELIDKDTKEKIQGSKLQIIKVNDEGKEELLKEIETKEENAIIEKLSIGEYILRQTEDVIKEKGYVRIKDKKFKLIDTRKTQKMIVEQDYTKIQIKVVDIDTLELVLGSTVILQDKDGNEITEKWISTKEPKILTRIPIGEIYIVEKEAPILRGYVKSEKVQIKVEETSDIQEFELKQDYTKLSLILVDKETKEEIKEAELIIKDEKGNQVAEISLKETEEIEKEIKEKDESNQKEQSDQKEQQKIRQVIKRLPVGKYIVESTSMQYGYKQLKSQIEVKDDRKIQIKQLEVEREIFDIKVEEWIEQIVRNGKQEYLNKKEEQTVRKLDIKDKKILTENIKITYKIRVKNIGKITGKVGKIEISIPQGMEFKKEDNKGYWKQEGGKIITEGLSGRELKEGAKAEVEITFRWKNGLENFGTKANTVRILEVTSDIGFKESNEENNIAVSKDVIIGVSTGEMNILWICWALLIFLILVEVYVTKKLHIKNFKIKDKTLKYRNKK